MGRQSVCGTFRQGSTIRHQASMFPHCREVIFLLFGLVGEDLGELTGLGGWGS